MSGTSALGGQRRMVAYFLEEQYRLKYIHMYVDVVKKWLNHLLFLRIQIDIKELIDTIII